MGFYADVFRAVGSCRNLGGTNSNSRLFEEKNILPKSGRGAAITPLPPCSDGPKLLTANRPQGKEM